MNPTEGQPAQNQPRPNQSASLGSDLVGSDLLSELTSQQAPEQVQPQEPQSKTAFAIIPEDGVIKQHQLQQRPDSDSYLEIDNPAGSNSNATAYRFNLSGNQAFVISQGMDRLENAFSFEKPTNRQVSQIVQQGDGLLTKVGNGWKIERKARIDFR
ncbi:hypothetical protein TH63_07650 [Rufibacter radiotolerans]|uniref:Uncharacterized protein n=2 Tax=Rufibacter radiotolerans TaxID=1379910 RepID=A0A0H4VP92_9BACT|nr:hypothetical protein TH63_07650 [Rufibacter radiotolerans]